ncbi:acetate--CoA ligase family protein [Roseomonas sp. AR75]|uniref:acetate--CoA ligase family protein n=1 Tax=Roseomonas sp. AR75 TaxID=2562311 RepID=UPI0010C0AE2D|nr:acetate--CoA ligase family protein [Roseomonas sp. AR75]
MQGDGSGEAASATASGVPQVLLLAGSARTAEAMQRAAAKRLLPIAARTGADAAALLAAALDSPARILALVQEARCDGTALCAALGAARAAGRIVVLLPADGSVSHAGRMLLAAEGAVLVAAHRELLDTALFAASLARTGLPAGPRVAIMTGGGGGGVIAADLCGAAGLEVPPLSEATRAALAPLVPAIASTANPVDLTPEAFNEKTYDRFPRILDIVAADPDVDAVFLPTTFNAPRGAAVAAQVLAEFHARAPKPVLIAAGTPPAMLPVFAQHGVAPIADVAAAAATLGKLVARGRLAAPVRRSGQAAAPWTAEHLPARLAAAGFARSGEAEGDGRVLPLALSGWRDPAFGAVVAVGAGGIAGRVLEEQVVAPAPLDADGALALLGRSRAVAQVARMEPALDRAALARALSGLAQLVAGAPWPRFRLRLDPVLAGAGPPRAAEPRLSLASEEC